MEIERMFLNSLSIEKKPADICELIEAAIYVGALKHPAEFEKRKNRIIKMIMHPEDHDLDDDDEDDDISTLCDDEEEEDSVGDEDDDISTLDDDEEEEDSVGDEDDVTSIEEPEKEEEDGLGTQQITAESKKPLLKIKVIINKTVLPELKKSSETDLDVADTPQSHTTMASRKRMSLMNKSTKLVQVAPPSVRIISDLSFEKQLDGDKQLQKQSHKGFNKMESDHDTEKKKGGAQQTPTQRRRKECTTGLTKMNVATKPVQVAHHQRELLPDCSPQKQRNCSSIRRPMQKETQNFAVARPMQKEALSISDMKKKFESSKRKFEERLTEQREAKRRIVMVDFHDMPKPANDSRAPKRLLG